MSVLTYCKNCQADIIIEVVNHNEYEGYCDKCYFDFFSPETILRKHREKKLQIILETPPLLHPLHLKQPYKSVRHLLLSPEKRARF